MFVIILCRLLSALAALPPCSVRSLDGPSQTARANRTAPVSMFPLSVVGEC